MGDRNEEKRKWRGFGFGFGFGWGIGWRRRKAVDESGPDPLFDEVTRPSLAPQPSLPILSACHLPFRAQACARPAPRAPRPIAPSQAPAAPAVSPTSEAIGKVFADHIGSKDASLSLVFPDIVCSATSYEPSRHARHV